MNSRSPKGPSSLRGGATRAELREDVEALSALADETRYTLAREIAGRDSPTVGALTESVEVSDSAVSHALADLRAAGLVTSDVDGRRRRYEATSRLRWLLAALDTTRGSDGGGPR
ncbi:MAG: ArsR/SmtB family transcription factor [Halobacteriota archaeon]